MGTVLWRNGSVSFAQSKRASTHLRTCVMSCTSGAAPLPGDHNLASANIHLKACQRPRRRTRNVSPVEPVRAIVASAPDFDQVGAVLNGAAEMRAHRGHAMVFALRGEQQQRRTVAEPEHFRTVRFEVSDPPRHD